MQGRQSKDHAAASAMATSQNSHAGSGGQPPRVAVMAAPSNATHCRTKPGRDVLGADAQVVREQHLLAGARRCVHRIGVKRRIGATIRVVR